MCIVIVMVNTVFSQSKKPTLMIVPGDEWCSRNGYMMDDDNSGMLVKVPDYKKAFQKDSTMNKVIGKLKVMMADKKFTLKSAELIINSVGGNAEKDNTKAMESTFDKLKKAAGADIILQLNWTVIAKDFLKSVTFNLLALDAYTDKQVAFAQGTGAPSLTADVPALVEEAMVEPLDSFAKSLQTHFNDRIENGKEITLRIKKLDSWSGDLEKEYGGKELSSAIEDWLKTNTVKGKFKIATASRNMMIVEKVRIPFYDERANEADAKGFLKGLQQLLNSPPYSINTKLMMKGLGQATIILGDK